VATSTRFRPGQNDYIEQLNGLADLLVGTYALTDGATITVDLSNNFRVASVTLASGVTRSLVVTGGTAEMDGRPFSVKVKQGGAALSSLTAGAGVGFGSDITGMPTFTTGVGKVDALGFIYDHALSKALLVAYSRGYS
jgi:hypothetical protein